MKTTKSGKPILSPSENIVKEIQEARSAQERADIQRLQREKKLYSIPTIIRRGLLCFFVASYIVLVIITLFRYNTPPVQSQIVEITKFKEAKTLVLPCTGEKLPETGATI